MLWTIYSTVLMPFTYFSYFLGIWSGSLSPPSRNGGLIIYSILSWSLTYLAFSLVLFKILSFKFFNVSLTNLWPWFKIEFEIIDYNGINYLNLGILLLSQLFFYSWCPNFYGLVCFHFLLWLIFPKLCFLVHKSCFSSYLNKAGKVFSKINPCQLSCPSPPINCSI